MKKIVAFLLVLVFALGLTACGGNKATDTTKDDTEGKTAVQILEDVWAAYEGEKFAIAGGVASNSTLRGAMKDACEKNGIEFYHPSPIFCTDNAAMIGVAAYYEYMAGVRHGWDLNAVPNLKLGERI